MQRRREIAAAPARSAGETIEVVATLIRDTLTRSESVDAADVDSALAAARPALLGLVAGGHLDDEPLVLVAPPIHLSVTTISGDGALTLEENLQVPGGAGVDAWTIHLPTPDPLVDVISNAARASDHLSAEPAPEPESEAKATAGALDRDALRERLMGT